MAKTVEERREAARKRYAENPEKQKEANRKYQEKKKLAAKEGSE